MILEWIRFNEKTELATPPGYPHLRLKLVAAPPGPGYCSDASLDLFHPEHGWKSLGFISIRKERFVWDPIAGVWTMLDAGVTPKQDVHYYDHIKGESNSDYNDRLQRLYVMAYDLAVGEMKRLARLLYHNE